MRTPVILKFTERVPVAKVLEIMWSIDKKRPIRLNTKDSSKSVYPSYRKTPDGKSEMANQSVERFIKFCKRNGITPTDTSSPNSVEYSGLDDPKTTHTISIDEFRKLAREYGFDLLFEDPGPTATPSTTLPVSVSNTLKIPEVEISGVAMASATQKSDQPKLPMQMEETTTSQTEIPGKMPRTGAGRLAVEAAWQIECRTNRPASCKDVMTQLQEWADDGSKAGTLVSSDRAKRAIFWTTMTGCERKFDVEACRKALETWNKSRNPEANPEAKQNLATVAGT